MEAARLACEASGCSSFRNLKGGEGFEPIAKFVIEQGGLVKKVA
jgi:hypothetical protein